ncbi:hypothetical protein [Brevibacterium sanguinis]|nr:hypothetical protein [Brevibacterium sanguinis]
MNQPGIVARSEELGVPISKGNVSRYLSGNHSKPTWSTLNSFATVFDVPVEVLEEAAAFTGREPFTPDPRSDLLTAPQRAAVNEIIRLMAEANQRAGDGHATTSHTRAGGRPDQSERSLYVVQPPSAEETAASTAPSRAKEEKKKSQQRGEETQDHDQ